jgi:hypothetical protein
MLVNLTLSRFYHLGWNPYLFMTVQIMSSDCRLNECIDARGKEVLFFRASHPPFSCSPGRAVSREFNQNVSQPAFLLTCIVVSLLFSSQWMLGGTFQFGSLSQFSPFFPLSSFIFLSLLSLVPKISRVPSP